jgi:uridine kinase
MYFDYVFYVDCPRRERFSREREGAQQQLVKFQTRYWPAEDHYLREDQPLVRADRVIRG